MEGLPGLIGKFKSLNINQPGLTIRNLKGVMGMSIKRGFKVLLTFLLVMILSSLFAASALAATVNDVSDNSLRVGGDVYYLDDTTSYIYNNVLDSIRNGGSNYYFKIDERWYDLLDENINTLEDLKDETKAVPLDDVRVWDLRKWYRGPGDYWEFFEPIYRVEHYQQDVTGDGYAKHETTIHNGPRDTEVTAEALVYTGFTLNEIKSTMSGDIKPDGTLAVSYTHLDVYKRQQVRCLLRP